MNSLLIPPIAAFWVSNNDLREHRFLHQPLLSGWHTSYSQFKVKDIIRLDIQLVRNGLHEQRVMLAGERWRNRGVCSFTVFGLIFGFRAGRRSVELLVD